MKLQPCPCETVTRCPATVRAPVRAGPVVAATAITTPPDPFPDAPACTVIHDASLEAFHVHPRAVVTLIFAVPPPAATEWFCG